MDIEKFEDLLRSKKDEELHIGGADQAWEKFSSQITPPSQPLTISKSSNLYRKLGHVAAGLMIIGFVYFLGYTFGEKSQLVTERISTLPIETKKDADSRNMPSSEIAQQQSINSEDKIHQANEDGLPNAQKRANKSDTKSNIPTSSNQKSIAQSSTLNIVNKGNIHINELPMDNLSNQVDQKNESRTNVVLSSSATDIAQANLDFIENTQSAVRQSDYLAILDQVPPKPLLSNQETKQLRMELSPIVIKRIHNPKNTFSIYATKHPKVNNVGFASNYSRKILDKWSLEAGFSQLSGNNDIPPLRKPQKVPKEIHVPRRILNHDRPKDPNFRLHAMAFEFENLFLHIGAKYKIHKFCYLGLGGEFVQTKIGNSTFNYKAQNSDIILPVKQPAVKIANYYTPYLFAQIDYPIFRKLSVSARIDVNPSLNDDLKFYNKGQTTRGALGLTYYF